VRGTEQSGILWECYWLLGEEGGGKKSVRVTGLNGILWEWYWLLRQLGGGGEERGTGGREKIFFGDGYWGLGAGGVGGGKRGV